MNTSQIIKIALAVIVIVVLYKYITGNRQYKQMAYATTSPMVPISEKYTDNMHASMYGKLKAGEVDSRKPKVRQPIKLEDAVPTARPMTASVDLLPKPAVSSDAQAMGWDDYAPNDLATQNLLEPAKFIGVDTQGSSLRNASYDIRRDPPIVRKDIGPFLNSSIEADPYKKPLDLC
jgi:hypothetical protein